MTYAESQYSPTFPITALIEFEHYPESLPQGYVLVSPIIPKVLLWIVWESIICH